MANWYREIARKMAQRENYEREMTEWYESHYEVIDSELVPKQTLDIPYAVFLIKPAPARKVIDNQSAKIAKGIEIL